jgi:hypothetical protein
MPIWGLDIAAASDCEASVDILKMLTKAHNTSSGEERAYEREQDVRKKKA